ncbi:MAG: hypothetical protein AAB629_01860 [Patescibacteria group bacterium]
MRNPIIEIPPSPFKHGGPEHHTGIKHDGESSPESTTEGTLKACGMILDAIDPQLILESHQQFNSTCSNRQLDLPLS